MSSFLWVRCPEAAAWQRVKEMAKRHPHKWDMGADGTLIAVLFTAVEVLPRCHIEVRNCVCLQCNRWDVRASPEQSPQSTLDKDFFFLLIFLLYIFWGRLLTFQVPFFLLLLLQVFFYHGDTPGALTRRRIIREKKKHMRKCKRVAGRKP